MKNTLSDLNNYLFEAIERVNDDELTENALDKELKRSRAVNQIARTIVENGKLALSAKKYYDEFGEGGAIDVPLLEKNDKNKKS